MAQISPDTSGIVDGAVADAADFTTPLNTIINEINGNLDNSNIKSGANIAWSKLASAAFSTWTSTLSGWSGTPTYTARYQQIGKIVHFHFVVDTGTSNATTATFTLPVTPKSDGSVVMGFSIDNGSVKTTAARTIWTAASTTATAYTDMSTGAWTASGTKRFFVEATYEAA